MSEHVNLDTLDWPCAMSAADEPTPAVADGQKVLLGRHPVHGPTSELLAFAINADAADVLTGAIARAEGRDAAQAAARERGWQRDIAQRERDQARRELADLREAHADRLRQLRDQPRYVSEALHVLRERDQLRAQLSHALDVLDRIGADAACAADRGAGE